MKEEIRQFERELEMAINNLYVLHDCGATQQELKEQNSRIVYLKAIIENMKAYEAIRDEPQSEEEFFEELEEELEYKEKVFKELGL